MSIKYVKDLEYYLTHRGKQILTITGLLLAVVKKGVIWPET